MYHLLYLCVTVVIITPPTFINSCNKSVPCQIRDFYSCTATGQGRAVDE